MSDVLCISIDYHQILHGKGNRFSRSDKKVKRDGEVNQQAIF